MRLYLVRHGQTEWNLQSKAQGHSDVPLDQTGLAQAEALAKALSGRHIDRIIASDLSRAVTTAMPTAQEKGVTIETRFDLRERAFGEWEGLDFGELMQRKREVATSAGIGLEEVVPPSGESILMVWDRLAQVARDLRQGQGSIMVVTHGGTCALLLAQLVLGTVHTARSFRFANAAITELLLRPEGSLMMVRYNDHTHLESHIPLAGDLEGSHRSS